MIYAKKLNSNRVTSSYLLFLPGGFCLSTTKEASSKYSRKAKPHFADAPAKQDKA